MKYHPHVLLHSRNPRQPYYGIKHYAGALSWYSRPYVDALIDSAYWQKNQDQWAKGSATYFDKNNVSNELKGWKYWKSGNDFSDIFLYIVMSMIFEKKQALSPSAHAWWKRIYELSLTEAQSVTDKRVYLETAIDQLKSENYPQTLSDLVYAYNRFLVDNNISTTEAIEDTFSTSDVGRRQSSLTQEEREQLQKEIELSRTPSKNKQEKKGLTKKQKRRIGISTGLVSVGLLGILFLSLKK